MFVRSNPLNYGFLEKLTSAEMNLVDSQLPNALDIVNGGAYTLLVDCTVNGTALFTFACPLNVDGVANFNNGVSFFANTQLFGTTEIGGATSVFSGITWTAGSFLSGDAAADFAWAGTANFTGPTNVTALLTLTGGLVVSAGGIVFDTPIDLSSTMTALAGSTFGFAAGSIANFETPIALGVGGYVQHRKKTGSTTDNIHYSIAVDGDRIIWPSLSADITAFIDNATEGAEMIVGLLPTGSYAHHRILLKRADTTVIDFLEPVGNGAGTALSYHLLFTGGAWVQHTPSINPV